MSAIARQKVTEGDVRDEKGYDEIHSPTVITARPVTMAPWLKNLTQKVTKKSLFIMLGLGVWTTLAIVETSTVLAKDAHFKTVARDLVRLTPINPNLSKSEQTQLEMILKERIANEKNLDESNQEDLYQLVSICVQRGTQGKNEQDEIIKAFSLNK